MTPIMVGRWWVAFDADTLALLRMLIQTPGTRWTSIAVA